MNRLLMVLVLVLTCTVAMGANMELLNANGNWVPVRGDASGALVISGTVSGSGSTGASSGVVTNLASDSAGNLLVRPTGLTGNMRSVSVTIATNTVTTLSSLASGAQVPFWLSLENVGAGRVRISDTTATPTIWSASIAASSSWAPRYYSATTTISGSLMAPDGTVSTVSALLEW